MATLQGQRCGLQGEGVLRAGASLSLPPPRVAVPGEVDRPRSWPQGRSEGALLEVCWISMLVSRLPL